MSLSEQKGGRQFSRRRRILFSLLPTLLLVLLAEGWARLYPFQNRTAIYSGRVLPDPELVWKLKPFQSGSLATNELGLRDDPHRPDAQRRIIVLGDSVTWGHGIEERQLVYPQLLEKALNQNFPRHSIEVVNAGVPGYSTFQERRWLERDGWQLKPDAVLLQFNLNDIMGPYITVARYGGDNQFMGVDTRQATQDAFGWLLQHSRAFERLMRGLQSLARTQEKYEVELLLEKPLSSELEAAWLYTLSELELLWESCRSRRVPLFIVITPYRFQLASPDTLRQPQDRLLEFAQARGIPVLDLLPPLSEVQRKNPAELFQDSNHPTHWGHRVLAQMLLVYLEKVLPWLTQP